MGIDILVIPDTQVVPGSPIEHFVALGNLAVERKPEYIVHIGDHWDMNALSSYDVGKKAAENARYQDDIEAGVYALACFEEPIRVYSNQRIKNKKKPYKPEKHFAIGNHENRIMRYVNDYPVLAGKLSFNDLLLEEEGWVVHNYLEMFTIRGVTFSHLFLNPESNSRRPFTSTVDTQLKNLGFSFVAGHLPGLYIANPRYRLDGTITRGVVAGSFYLHDFSYQNPPQGNQYWRGALMLREVNDGNFMLEEIPINWLMENYL